MPDFTPEQIVRANSNWSGYWDLRDHGPLRIPLDMVSGTFIGSPADATALLARHPESPVVRVDLEPAIWNGFQCSARIGRIEGTDVYAWLGNDGSPPGPKAGYGRIE